MKTICVLGGTGFVGNAIVHQLSEAGYLVKVLTRSCQNGKHLASVKNVQVIECDIFNEATLKQNLKSAVAVINLIGILHESKKQSFQRIHADIPKNLAKICVELGIPRLLHMSALKASHDAPSRYLKSKAQGGHICLITLINLTSPFLSHPLFLGLVIVLSTSLPSSLDCCL